VTDDSPLCHPAKIYTPFDAAETERLQTYVDDVAALAGMSFFADPGRSLRREGVAVGNRINLLDIDDEAIRAVVGLFRSIHLPGERTSFFKTFDMLKRHVVRGSPRRVPVLHELQAFLRWEEELLDRTPTKIVVGEKTIAAREIVDAYLHARYLHKDAGIWRRSGLHVVPEGLSKDEFLRVIHTLTQLYWVGRNAVKPILTTPSLLPASVGVGSATPPRTRACA
jgi:hypothetical protein